MRRAPGSVKMRSSSENLPRHRRGDPAIDGGEERPHHFRIEDSTVACLCYHGCVKHLHQSVKAKLLVTPNVAQELKATMRQFARTCNLIAEVAFNQHLHRRYDLHHTTYKLARGQTNLPSQHVINAIAKVSEAFTREPEKLH